LSQPGGRNDLLAPRFAGCTPLANLLQAAATPYAHLARIEPADVVAG